MHKVTSITKNQKKRRTLRISNGAVTADSTKSGKQHVSMEYILSCLHANEYRVLKTAPRLRLIMS